MLVLKNPGAWTHAAAGLTAAAAASWAAFSARKATMASSLLIAGPRMADRRSADRDPIIWPP